MNGDGEFRALAHRALDDALDAIDTIRERPAWQPVPDVVKDAIAAPLPRRGIPFAQAYADFTRDVAPYPTGNVHPAFFGWVHGGGTPEGVVAELLAAAMNANVGGREHAAVYVERTVVRWFSEAFGFPADASGIITTGTSMGNLLAVLAARDRALGTSARAGGIAGARLTAYTLPGAHDSVAKALRIAGLGEAALRAIPLEGLRAAIAADRAAGARPFLIAATAGAVATGAFDPLDPLADIAQAEGLWLHVDGAFGAFAALSPARAHLVRGMARADSLAFDAHKLLQVPYAAGCVLFRDEAAHRAAFASSPAYLARAERGAAAGAPWFTDYGIELSREFRALKLWFALRTTGFDGFGALLDRLCDLAAGLAARVEAEPELELMAPAPLCIVCFRYAPPGQAPEDLDALNDAIAVAVQESGRAVASTVRVGGRLALRACIMNHRTTAADTAALVEAVLAAGRRL